MSKIKNFLIASLLFSLAFILFFSFSSIEYSGISSPNSEILPSKRIASLVDIEYIASHPKTLLSQFSSINFSNASNFPLQHVISSTVNDSITLDLPNCLHKFQWFHFCQDSLQILKSWPLFPNFPFTHTTISSLTIQITDSNSVHRIFGYLIPPTDGKYTFASNQITSLELWLSKDRSTDKLSLIPLKHLQINQLANSSITSEDIIIDLRKDKYFYLEFYFSIREILQNEVLLFWLLPGQEHFSIIDKEYFGATSIQADQTSQAPNPPYPPYANTHTLPTIRETKNKFISLPYLDLSGIDELYKECEYKPSFAYPRTVYRYKGVEMIGPMVLSVYPDDMTSFNGKINDQNPSIPQNEADSLLTTHTEVILNKWPNIQSVTLINIEVQRDPQKGNRYLVDIVVELDAKHFQFSSFIFSPTSHSENLCQPKGFRYNSKAFVHIALSIKNQGHWFLYFIENVERIYRETKDENFGIIVIDFESEDVDTEMVVKKSLIPNKVFVRMEGRYERASSLNKALEQVESEDDIVFTCDLHLDMPNDILESIRKHSIQGFSAYAPIVFRLECGRTILDPGGFWESVGYGLFSMYKSDWNNVGAFDSQQFKDKWGGEDWDLVDRFISKGYFMDRKKQSHMLHFHHDRSQLW